MVIGGAYVQYSFKKLSTNNSTESKLVGVDNVLTQMIWTQYFLKDQGYDIRDNVIYQDNQSTIKLKRMVEYQVESGKDTSISDIILSLIG